MKKLFKRSVWTLLSVFFLLIFVIVLVAEQIAAPFSTWIDQFFGVTRYKLVQKGDVDPDEDTQYFKSDYAVKDESGNLVLTTDENGIKHQTYDNAALRAHSLAVAERVGEEGSVLLWNKNNALPLAADSKVSTFGVTSLDWLYHGTGSGQVEIENQDLQKILESRGLSVNKTMFTALKFARPGYGRGWLQNNKEDWNKYAIQYSIGEIPWSVLDSTSLGSVAGIVGSYGDAAIYTISRNGGEGSDTNMFECKESADGSYLSFTTAELSVLEGLQKLKKDGVIKKSILLINSAAALSFKNVEQYDVDACLWVGLGGNANIDYAADLLVGNANPSGHLTDTYVYDIMSAPSSENFGNYTYTEYTGASKPAFTDNTIDKYVVYQEGIYVGYRYYETRYEDLVIGGRQANSTAGAKQSKNGWSYGEEVAYPFGHGESYTTFAYSDYSVKEKGDNYEVKMTVKNTGAVAGKEVMQVYLQKPYTEYDKTNKVEKSAVELVGFAKTKLLEPNEPQTLTVTVPKYEFKSYDAYGAGTYILEKGSYYLAAGTNAHDALNNILAKKGYNKSNGMDADGNAAFANEIKIRNNDFETYSESPTGYTVQNQFSDVDLNLYEGTADQKITYLSRSNWGDTYPSPVTLTCTNAKMVADIQPERQVENNPDDITPTYNTVTYEGGKLSLIQLMGVPYGDQLWDHLLNQLSFEEQVDLVRYGTHTIAGAKSVAAPGFRATDGPCGMRAVQILEGLTTKMAFPCNGIVASTWNTELVEELGDAYAEEILAAGRSGVYGTGCNIHRHAYLGRTWEYYSEDGFLTGKMYAATNNGLMGKGIVLFTKHFALNDMETNRAGVSTWANEQSIREIYLKAFEAGITEGHTSGIMTTYGRIGTTWTGAHKGLLTEVLRNEWGFVGIAETDAGAAQPHISGSPSVFAAGLIAGQDVWMGGMTDKSLDGYKDNATVCLALREAAHRNLYTQLNSAAMNGMSSSTDVVYVKPAWEKAVLAGEIISGILAAACLGMVAASWVLWYKDKRENQYK